MDEVKIFENPDFGQVRTVLTGDSPCLVDKDVAEELGYKATADALESHVDEEDKHLIKVGEIPTLF